jgi:hypothetical protein
LHTHADAKPAVQKPEPAHHNSSGHAHVGVPEAQGSLITAIGGSAAAVGDSTAATGFIENFAQGKGNVSIAMGEAIFQASAHSAETGGALAAANTFLDVAGADIIFEFESAQSKQGPHGAWATSELDYFAIDISGWSPPHGPIVIQVQQPFGHLDQPLGHETSYGDFAHVFAAAEAHGLNALSATFTNALTIENHFSFVNAVGSVAL